MLNLLSRQPKMSESLLTNELYVPKLQPAPAIGKYNVLLSAHFSGSYGVMAITLDIESNNPSSNLGRTLIFCSANWRRRENEPRYMNSTGGMTASTHASTSSWQSSSGKFY